MSISSRVAFASPEMTIRDSHGAFPYNPNPDTDINAITICYSDAKQGNVSYDKIQ